MWRYLLRELVCGVNNKTRKYDLRRELTVERGSTGFKIIRPAVRYSIKLGVKVSFYLACDHMRCLDSCFARSKGQNGDNHIVAG